MSNKTPYEIRLELIQEARLILQAQANKPDLMPSTEDVIKEAEKLLDPKDETKIQKIWPFNKKKVIKNHPIFKKIKISGEKCQTKTQVKKVIQALQIQQSVLDINSLWKGMGIDIELPPLQLLNILEFYVSILEKCFSIKEKFKELENDIPIFKGENWSRNQTLEKAIYNTELVIFEKMLKLIQNKLKKSSEEIKDKIYPDTHPLIKSLVSSLEERDPESYQSNLDAIFELQQEKKYYFSLRSTCKRTNKSDG